jgi:hypothetical protein
MQTDISRRDFCGASLALAIPPSASLIRPALAAHTSAASINDDRHLIELCRAHIAMEDVIEALWARHVDAFNRVIEIIGECPATGDANHRWWDLYRQSEGWTTEEISENADDQQCKLMDQIVRIPAVTIAGIAAKLDLWRRTDADYIGGNDVLWNGIADDIEAMCGVRIAEAVES